MKQDRPYGSWVSELSSQELATSAKRLSEPRVFQDEVLWLESRPEESGRTVIVKFDGADTATLGPDELNVRTLVHEYGGGSWLPTKHGILLSSFSDQRLWLLNDDFRPVTKEPSTPKGLRYSDGVIDPDSDHTIWVVERHHENHVHPENLLASVNIAGEIIEVASGADFYSSPTISPDGKLLAYLSWDHPSMPWDHVQLHVAQRGNGKWTQHRVVLDGPALQQPQFSPDGRLHVISDATGWWNIHEVDLNTNSSEPVVQAAVEFGIPGWVFGQKSYTWAKDELWCSWVDQGTGHLGQITNSLLTETDCALTEFNGLDTMDDGRVVTVAASWEATPAVVAIDTDGRCEQLSDSHSLPIARDEISIPEAIEVPGSSGHITHAFHFTPKNSAYECSSELPPLIVLSHGGPTGAARSSFDPAIQYWTNRGIAVVDVNYRGSTGFGTPYRNLLRGQWGVADTEDCIATAQHLANNGLVDAERLTIKGGSAGGFTTLCALTMSNLFAAGISRYGVADLATLARDTHKFEARYLDSLVGEWPKEKAIYEERSPIHHTHRLSTPMIVLQGSEDPVVPPSQAEQLVEALIRAKIPHSYLLFEGESHGFRKADTISRALDSELSFLGQVLGFEPADSIESVQIL